MDETTNNQPTSQPVPPVQPPVEPAHEGSSGPLIAVIVILAVILVGALYFWKERAVTPPPAADQTLESINTQSSSDEAAAIEADLNATDIDSLDAELNAS